MFSDTLKKLRLSKGLSQEELGDIIGVSKSTIGMYEQGQRIPKADTTFRKLAEYFGVSIDYLMGLEESPEPQSELDEYLEHLRTRPEMKMLFSLTKDATKEDVEKAVKIIEALLGKEGQ